MIGKLHNVGSRPEEDGGLSGQFLSDGVLSLPALTSPAVFKGLERSRHTTRGGERLEAIVPIVPNVPEV